MDTHHYRLPQESCAFLPQLGEIGGSWYDLREGHMKTRLPLPFNAWIKIKAYKSGNSHQTCCQRRRQADNYQAYLQCNHWALHCPFGFFFFSSFDLCPSRLPTLFLMIHADDMLLMIKCLSLAALLFTDIAWTTEVRLTYRMSQVNLLHFTSPECWFFIYFFTRFKCKQVLELCK